MRRPRRTWRSSLMARPPASEGADREQHGEREPEEHDRDRRGADRVVALDLAEDVDGRELRLERDVAGDEDDRAELADGAGEAHRGAGEDRGDEVREHDAPEDR